MEKHVVMSPTSCMGLVGIDDWAYDIALSKNPNTIASDAGSLDPGPHYLGTGLPHVAEYKMKNDCRIMMEGLLKRKTAMVMGSAGGSGGRSHIEWHLKIMDEVAREMNKKFKVAVIDTTLDKEYLKKRAREEVIEGLGHEQPLTEELVENATEIVAQIGVEPIIAALEMDPSIVLAGRACDNACFAAEPVRRGFNKGLSLHVGKILECGSASAIALPSAKNMRTPMIATMKDDYFIVEPATDGWVSTVRSTAGHEAYERTDPFYQLEPGGVLDMRNSKLSQYNERAVKISGSAWIDDPVSYKVKLEGAEKVGYRSMFIAGARDPAFLANIDWIIDYTKNRMFAELEPKGLYEGKDYHLVFRIYGKNGVMGPLEPQKDITSHELGIIMEVIAPTRELSHDICYFGKYGLVWCNYPGRMTISGNLAYAFSPSVIEGGEVYRLSVHHLLPIEDQTLFEIKLVEVG